MLFSIQIWPSWLSVRSRWLRNLWSTSIVITLPRWLCRHIFNLIYFLNFRDRYKLLMAFSKLIRALFDFSISWILCSFLIFIRMKRGAKSSIFNFKNGPLLWLSRSKLLHIFQFSTNFFYFSQSFLHGVLNYATLWLIFVILTPPRWINSRV